MRDKVRLYLEKVKIDEYGEKWINCDIYLHDLELKELDFHDINVKGCFICDDNYLESLEGAPKTVSRDFSCVGNRLTDLKGSPEFVGGSFFCSNNKLKSLHGSPDIVLGFYDCVNNDLETLDGISPKILCSIVAYKNKLKSLRGPQTFDGVIKISEPIPNDDYFIQYSLMDKIQILKKDPYMKNVDFLI